jgi:hypothetical protein
MITVLVDGSDWRSVQLADLHNSRQGGCHGPNSSRRAVDGDAARLVSVTGHFSGSRKAHKSMFTAWRDGGPDRAGGRPTVLANSTSSHLVAGGGRVCHPNPNAASAEREESFGTLVQRRDIRNRTRTPQPRGRRSCSSRVRKCALRPFLMIPRTACNCGR